MNGAAETLVSQAYGNGQLKLCGVHFNRGRLILTAFFIPLATLLMFSEHILIFIGQDPVVSAHTQEFLRYTLPAIYFYCMFDLTKRFLNCMTISWVPMTAQIVATVLHPFWCYHFVVVRDLDLYGIAIAYTITQLTLVVFATVYSTMVDRIKEAIILPDKDSLKYWWGYVKLGLPVTLMIWSARFALNIMTLFSGLISV